MRSSCERAGDLRQRALERLDGARHVAQADALLEQRLGRAQRDEVRERVGAATAPPPGRRHHPGAVQRAQPSRRDVEQPSDLAQAEQVRKRLAAVAIHVGRLLRRQLIAALHATATGPEHDMNDLVVALFLPTH